MGDFGLKIKCKFYINYELKLNPLLYMLDKIQRMNIDYFYHNATTPISTHFLNEIILHKH